MAFRRSRTVYGKAVRPQGRQQGLLKTPAVSKGHKLPASFGQPRSVIPATRPLNNEDVVKLHAHATDFTDAWFSHYPGPYFVDMKRDGERAAVWKQNDQVVIANKYKSVYVPDGEGLGRSDFPASARVVTMPVELADQIRRALGSHDGIFDAEYRAKSDDLYQFLSERTNPNSTQTMVSLFDVLELDGKDVRSEPLSLRKDILADVVTPQDRVEVDPTQLAMDKAEAEEVAKEYMRHGIEGGVIKPASHDYDSGEWMLKFKQARSIDVAVLGIEKTKDWVNRQVPHSFLVGLYDKKRKGWRVLGEVGTGLADDIRAAMGREVPKVELDPSTARQAWGSQYDSHFVYTSPSFVLEVTFARLTNEGHMREPRVIRIRDDKAPEECSVSQIDSGKTNFTK